MRRAVVLVAALCAALFIPSQAPAASVTLVTSAGLFGSYGNPQTNANFFVMVNSYREEQVGGAVNSFVNAQVSVSNGQPNGWANASGPLTFDFDPLLQQATIKGIVTGGQGPIAVDLTFFATTISTNMANGQLEIVPTAPQEAGGWLSLQRQGRIGGSVSSGPSGTVTGSNGYASANSFRSVRVQA